MARANSNLVVNASWLSKLSPVILWCLAFVLPIAVGRQLLLSALEIDERLWISSSKHLLMNEAQKYQTALNPDSFLREFVENDYVGSLYNKLYRSGTYEAESGKKIDKIAVKKELLSHRLVKELPWGSKNVRKDVKRFVYLMRQEIGILPSAVYCLGPDANSCFVETSDPFGLITSNEEFLSILQRAYNFWLERLSQKENDEEYFRKFNLTPEIATWLGYILNLQTDIFSMRTRFSSRTKEPVYQFIYMFSDANDENICLNLVYAKSKLNWRFILEKEQKKNNTGIVKHSFGFSSNNVFPLIRNSKEFIEIYFEPPMEFRKIVVAEQKKYLNKKLVLRLSIPASFRSNSIINIQQIDFVIKLLLAFSLMIVSGIYLGRFQNFRSLKIVVGLAFFTGSMVPISGLSWFGLSYLNSQKQFEARKMFDQLGEKLKEAENKILLQKARNAVYLNIMADRISRLSLEQRKKIKEIFDRFSGPFEFGEEVNRRPFMGYYVLNNDGSESFELRNSDRGFQKQMTTFFSGAFVDLMLSMGGFDHLSHGKKQEVIQKAQLAAGVTADIVDNEMFRKMLEQEGALVHSSLTSRNESLTSFILDKSETDPGGIISFFSDNFSWEFGFAKSFNNGTFPVRFNFNGYKITLTFYPLDYNNIEQISHVKVSPEIINHKDQERFFRMAKAFFANSDTAEINNLAQKPPHLVLTRIIADQNVFAMAYAEKMKTSMLEDEEILVFGAIAFALVSSLFLAIGTARYLLISIPVFVTAIEEVQNRNYLWELKVSSGDEFEELSKSFNLMGRKLLEREKMAQLVSENVLEAVSSEDESMLKPGGEKLDATILFSDIRGFTTLSEKYKAEEIVEMLNSYFTVMAEVIVENGGIIDKLIGDAIQAVFYNKEGLEASEIRATRSALEMQRRLIDFNWQRKKDDLFPIENGFGIATGMVISGRVGSETGKLDATVLGKTLHRAENLESLSKNVRKSNILIDQTTLVLLHKHGLMPQTLPYKSDQVKENEAFELVRF